MTAPICRICKKNPVPRNEDEFRQDDCSVACERIWLARQKKASQRLRLLMNAPTQLELFQLPGTRAKIAKCKRRKRAA